MHFVPLTSLDELPAVDSVIERTTLDLKVKPAPNAFEKAKDVTAFANHVGGTLIVGAHEVDGRLAAYVGLDDAGSVRDAYSKAVAELCQPHPLVDFQDFAVPGSVTKRVVAVNIWPSLNLVGVKVLSHPNANGYGGVSFVYPVRSGTDASYLEPNQLAMYMTPAVRRVVVMLSRVPKGARLRIKTWVPTTALPGGRGQHEYTAVLDEVLEEQNLVTLRATDDERPIHRLPLDCITTVYEDWDATTKSTQWKVIVDFER